MNSLSAVFALVSNRPQRETAEQWRERKDREHAQVRTDMIRANRERYVAKLRRESGLGDRFLQRTFATWKPAPETANALEAAKAAIDPRFGAWLTGAVGAGKSHLCAATVNAALDAGVPALFTTTVALLDRLRSSYGRDGAVREGASDIVKQCVDVDILVLDDIGKERFSPWSAEKLYELVNGRYEAGRAVIVTSNVSPTELAAHWKARDVDPHIGESITRRLIEMAGRLVSL